MKTPKIQRFTHWLAESADLSHEELGRLIDLDLAGPEEIGWAEWAPAAELDPKELGKFTFIAWVSGDEESDHFNETGQYKWGTKLSLVGSLNLEWSRVPGIVEAFLMNELSEAEARAQIWAEIPMIAGVIIRHRLYHDGALNGLRVIKNIETGEWAEIVWPQPGN